MGNQVFQKDGSGMIEHKHCLETRPEELDSFITPNRRFFVCNDSETALISLDDYRLTIEGDGVSRPLSLSYDEILKLPSHTVIAYLECAGNLRHLFELVNGDKPTSDTYALTPWLMGGIGNAVWTGVRLGTLLEMAGVRSNAVDVNAKGLDETSLEGGVSRPMSIEKALDPDTLLAYFMNGEPLPADHGFPLRLIAPGWIGSNSIKWVGQITVSAEKIWVDRNTNHYVNLGPEWPAEDFEPAAGGTIDQQNIKSTLSLPWPAELPPGKQLIRGIARAPEAIIEKVEWSDDGGETWQAARLLDPVMQYAWARFEFEWEATAGEHILMTRATDAAGNTQPEKQPFNREGYLFNQIVPHPIRV